MTGTSRVETQRTWNTLLQKHLLPGWWFDIATLNICFDANNVPVRHMVNCQPSLRTATYEQPRVVVLVLELFGIEDCDVLHAAQVKPTWKHANLIGLEGLLSASLPLSAAHREPRVS